jgi:hypothetical protein
MTRITVDFPFVHVTNPITGRNAALSSCYFGVPDGNPYSNPADRVPVYVVQPNGTELLITQPVLLNAAGVMVYNGVPAQLKVDGQYSLVVVSASGVQLYYSPRTGTFEGQIETRIDALEIEVNDLQADVAGIIATQAVAYLNDFAHLVVNDDWSEALIACIASLRTNPVNLLQYIGGPEITAYSSGVVVLGRRTYKIRAGAVNITQDLGLTIKGQGSRRTNKSVKAPSTILVTGVSTSTNYFGIKLFGNGARGAHFEDFDLNYDNAGFTGDLIHTVQTPGFTTNRIRLGWHNSPLASARSCVRTAFDEFHKHTDIVMDGAVTPWLSDTTTILSGPSDFGGSTHMLINPVFYDATDCYMKHAANRTRQGLIIQNPSFDVIDVAMLRAVDLANIDGFNWVGGICASSDVIVATQEWIRLDNVTGYINGVCFNDLVKAGTLINSNIEVSGCRFFCNDGLVFNGGSYTVHSNEVAKAISGFTVDPSGVTDVNFGQNYFGPLVTHSYRIPASATTDVYIDYNKFKDLSVNKWFVPSDSNRVKIVNSANPRATFATATLSPTIYDTGTEYVSVGTAAQTVTLPTPTQGVELTFTHIAQQPLTLQGAILSGTHTSNNTSASVTTSTHVGQTITLEGYSNVAWKVKSATGAWTYGT